MSGSGMYIIGEAVRAPLMSAQKLVNNVGTDIAVGAEIVDTVSDIMRDRLTQARGLIQDDLGALADIPYTGALAKADAKTAVTKIDELYDALAPDATWTEGQAQQVTAIAELLDDAMDRISEAYARSH